MDPATLVGLVNASLDLALKCASAVKELNDIASKYKHAKITILSMTQNLDTMQLAWDRISAWSQEYIPYEDADEDGFVRRMARFLETGTLVLDALEEELLPFSDDDPTTLQRVRLVWNEASIQCHQSRIRDQAASMSLLLQAVQLPTATERKKLVHRSEKQFQKSDESAYSIVPSRMSMSTRKTDDSASIRSEDSLIYRQLSFENDLFTARVYKRNYRKSMISQLLKRKLRKSEDTVRPTAATRITSTSLLHCDEGRHITKNLEADKLTMGAQNINSQPHETREHNDITSIDNRSVEVSELMLNDRATSQSDDDIGDDETLDPRLKLNCQAVMRTNTLHIPATRDSFTSAKVSSPSPTGEENQVVGMVGDKSDLRDSGTFLSASGRLVTMDSIPGWSGAYMYACEHGDHQTVEALLGKGQNVHATYSYHGFPDLEGIHVAVLNGHFDTVNVLLRHGASLETETMPAGLRLLQLAARTGNHTMVQFLIDCGAQISVEKTLGEQPTHLAAESRSIETLQLLIENGAIPSVATGGSLCADLPSKISSLATEGIVNCMDYDRRQLIDRAAESPDQPEVIRFLASMNTNLSTLSFDKFCETPLSLGLLRRSSGECKRSFSI